MKQSDLDLAREQLKAYVLQYLLISKLIVKNQSAYEKKDKTIEEQIKVDKLNRSFDASISELIKCFDRYFKIEEAVQSPINLDFRRHYRKLREAQKRGT